VDAVVQVLYLRLRSAVEGSAPAQVQHADSCARSKLRQTRRFNARSPERARESRAFP